MTIKVQPTTTTIPAGRMLISLIAASATFFVTSALLMVTWNEGIRHALKSTKTTQTTNTAGEPAGSETSIQSWTRIDYIQSMAVLMFLISMKIPAVFLTQMGMVREPY